MAKKKKEVVGMCQRLFTYFYMYFYDCKLTLSAMQYQLSNLNWSNCKYGIHSCKMLIPL